jgi:NAD(P)H-flavin reductase
MKGYITDDVLKSIVNLDDPDTLFAHCGPKAMNNCLAAIFKQHHPNSTLFKL